jgi:hypothetical protein
MATWKSPGKTTGMYFDVSQFIPSFKKIAGVTIPKKAKNGLFKVGGMVIKDCLNEEPKVPREIGDLQASGVIVPHPWEIEITVGFNKDYAAKQHEAPDKKWNPKGSAETNWTTPGTGPKYLETKLVRHKEKYFKFTAEMIKSG